MKIYKLSQQGKFGTDVETPLFFTNLDNAKKKLLKLYSEYKKLEDLKSIEWQDEDKMIFRANVYNGCYRVVDDWDVDYIYVGIEAIFTED